MDSEREEVFERIPWETLERKSADRQWLVYAVAGAVTLGALAYSFTRNQPVTPVATTVPIESSAMAQPPPAMPASPPTTAGPMVVAEADLYAIDPERLIDRVAAHAEWFATEYLAFDGSDRSRETIQSLLPDGVPPPVAPEGAQVFVDWARATQVIQVGELDYEVEVLVRSLASNGDSTFVRQPPRLLQVDVELSLEGAPRVSAVPVVSEPAVAERAELDLVDVPEDVAALIGPEQGEVVGGFQSGDGSWQIVVLAPGPDGVTRPVTIRP